MNNDVDVIEKRTAELRKKNPKLSELQAYTIAFRSHQQRAIPVDASFETHARAGLHSELERKSPGLAKRLYQNNPPIYRKEIALKLRSEDKGQEVKLILEPFVDIGDLASVVDQVLAYWPTVDGGGKVQDEARPELESVLKPYVAEGDLQGVLDELIAMWPTGERITNE